MNYFEHHIGDYAEATAHLSFMEDAAYSRCIRKYYATEKPLPPEVKAVQRLVGARSKGEREAVETILAEFFELQADGWHNARCDEEIARYQAGEPEREAKKANEETRLKRHREERSALFATLTAAGQHAPWNTGIKELRALAAALPAPGEPPLPATAPATPATATQTPLPTTQPPEYKTSLGAFAPPETIVERRAGPLEAIEAELQRQLPGEPDAPAPVTVPKAGKPDYPEEFERAWLLFPKRDGGNPKHEALKAWNARRREGVTPEDMIAGVERYAAHCRARGKIGTAYVLQAATFFGPARRYEEEWPAQAPQQGGKFNGLADIDHSGTVAAAARSRQQMGIDMNFDPNDPVDF